MLSTVYIIYIHVGFLCTFDLTVCSFSPSSSFKAPLVDSSDSVHSSTAVIMLVSVVLMGLAVFVIYKFKRYCIVNTVNILRRDFQTH